MLSATHNNNSIAKEAVLLKTTSIPSVFEAQVVFDCVHQNDTGVIEIKALNALGEDTCKVELTVADDFGQKIMPAGLMSKISDVLVKEGEQATISGKISGYPIPEIILLKQGKEINLQAPSTKYQMNINSDGSFDVSIRNCTFTDDDEYSLMVENIGGVDSCNFEVTVDCEDYPDDAHYQRRRLLKKQRNVYEHSDSEMDLLPRPTRRRIKKVIERVNPDLPRMTQLIPPRFDKILSDHDVIEGENIVMVVSASGTPEPELRFYKDGHLIEEDDKLKIRREEKPVKQHVLILKDIRRAEQAEYACQAVNSAGEAWCFSDVCVFLSEEEKLKAQLEREVTSLITDDIKTDMDEISEIADDAKVVDEDERKKKKIIKKKKEDKTKKVDGTTDQQKDEDTKKAKAEDEKLKKSEETKRSEAQDEDKTEDDKLKAAEETKKKEAENKMKAEADQLKAAEETKKKEADEKKKAKVDELKAAEETKKEAEDKKKTEADKLKAAEDTKKKEAEDEKKAEADKLKPTTEETKEKEAEDKKKAEADKLKAAEETKKKEAEDEKKAVADKLKVAEETKKEAEDKKKAEADKLKAAEETKKKEAENKKKAKADKLKAAEETKKKEAEDKKKTEADKLKAAEETRKKEAEDKDKTEADKLKRPEEEEKHKKKKVQKRSVSKDSVKKPSETAETAKITETTIGETTAAESKKKKGVPKALFIPDEISSRFGDPSTLHSETNFSTEITAREGSVEITSPLKQPMSASITMKVDSASKIRSRGSTPLEGGEFTFKARSKTPEKREEASAELKSKKQTEKIDKPGLPIPGRDRSADRSKEEEVHKSEVDQLKATEETRNKEAEEKKKAEADNLKAAEKTKKKEAEDKKKAEDDKLKAVEETKKKEAEDKKKAEADKLKSAEETKKKEAEVKKKAEADKLKSVEETKKKEAEDKKKAEADKLKAAEETKKKEAEVKKKAEADKLKAAEETKKKEAEDEKKAEADKLKAAEETKKKEAEVKKKAEADKLKAAEETKKKEAEDEKKAEVDKLKPAEETKKKEAEVKKKAEADKLKAAEDTKKKEAEDQKKAEADKLKAAEQTKKKEAEDKTKADSDKRKTAEETKKKEAVDKKNAEADKLKAAEETKKKEAEDKKKAKADKLKAAEETKKKEAEDKKKTEADKLKVAEETRKKEAEDKKKTEADKLKAAEETKKKEAEDMKKGEADKLKVAEETKKKEAEDKKKAEADKLKVAEETKKKEVEDKKKAEADKLEAAEETKKEEAKDKKKAKADKLEAAEETKKKETEDESKAVLNKAETTGTKKAKKVVKPKKSTEEVDIKKALSVEIGEPISATEEDGVIDGTPIVSETAAEEETTLSDVISRKSSTTSSAGSFTISRRQRRREGFVSVPLSEVLALRGDIVTVECELVNEEDQVEWFVNGSPANKNSRCQETSVGYIRSLLIADVTPDDTGLSVEVRLGEHIATTKLKVEETPVDILHKLDRKSSGTQDQDVVLTVTLNHPAGNVRWFKDGIEIEGSTHYAIDTIGASCSLTIKKTTYNDAGRYSIVADGAESYTKLDIIGKPAIKDVVKKVEVERGESLIINIPYECLPEPTVVCTLNGKPPSDIRLQTEITDSNVRLTKKSVTKADSGVYSICLSNDYGDEMTSIVVEVQDVPDAPKDISIENVETDNVTINWECPTDNCTGFVIEKKEEGRRTFHKVAQVSSARTSYTIEDLDMDTGYIFRVAAVNKFGIGEFAETKPVNTGTPYEPPVIEEPPLVEDITSTGCYLSWPKAAYDGGSPIYGYDVFRKENGGEWQKINDDLVFGEVFSVSNLQPRKTYHFKVEAVNEAGLRSNSNCTSQPVTLTEPISAKLPRLSPPKIIITGVDSVAVEWEAPIDEPTVEYTVGYKSEGASVWTEIECASTRCEIDGLKEGVTYVFKVAIRDHAGVGEFSEETVPIKMAANVPPTIIKAIKDITIPKKRELRLECHALGEPTPEFIWYKDGKEIIPADENTSITSEGHMSVLTIYKASDEHAGKYTCRVENKYGENETSANVSLSSVRAHFESSFSDITEVNEGVDFELTCEVSDEEAVVVWYKDGRKIAPGDRIQFFALGTKRTLKVKNASEEDNGLYRCETADGRSRTEGEVLVKEEEPHITVGPQDVVVSAFGQDVTLTCQLTKPVRRVKWYKNGQEVWPQMNKAIMSVDGKEATLQLKNVDAHDIGEYCCAVTDHEMSAPAHVELNVAPTVAIPENLDKEVVMHAGKDLEFHVEFTGFPVPTVMVTHNGLSIKTRAAIETYDDNISIRMKQLTKSDSGILKIAADNSSGSVNKEIHLSVIDVPSEPLNIQSRDTTISTTVVSWTAPSENNGAPILEYVIERKGVDNNRWRPVGKVKANEFVFEADELFSNQVYGFRIIAVNEVGESEPSASIDIMTEAEDDTISERSSIELFVPKIALLEQPQKPNISVEGTKVYLSWDRTPETSLFRIEREKKGEDDWMEIANIDKETFTDHSILETGKYRYRITGTGIHAISPTSEPTDFVTVVIPGTEDDQKEDQQEDKPDDEGRDDEKKPDDQINGKPTEDQQKQPDKKEEPTIEEKAPKTKKKVVKKKEKSESVTSEEAKAAVAEKDAEKTEPTPETEDAIPAEKKDKKTALKKKTERAESGASEASETSSQVGEKLKAKKKTDKKEASPVDDILDTKERLKKRKTPETDAKKKETQKTDDDKTSEDKEQEADKKKDQKDQKKEEQLKKPVVKPKQAEVSAKIGEPAVLVVETSGAEPLTVKWTKDDRSIDPSFVVETKPESTTLTIPKVDASASGTFVCSVTDANGVTTSTEITLKVNEKPSINAETTEVSVKAGEPAKIFANVVGSPEPRCQWTKDGVEVKVDKNLTTSCKDGSAQLTIKKTDSSHAGTYKLKATNENGTATTDILLTIKGAPSIPIGPVYVADASESSCRVEWKAPQSDGGSKLLGYTIDKKDVKKGAWGFVQRTTETSCIIDNLQPSVTYQFRVAAENANGNGPALESEKYELKAKQDQLTAAPGKPTLSSSTKSAISVEWSAVPVEDVQYLVEYKEAKSKRPWSSAHKQQPINNCELTVENLKQGTEYLFRVAAVKNGVQGPWSEESSAMMCEQKQVQTKPSFTNMPNAEVVAIKGHKAKVVAEFKGEPQPEVHWYKNKKEIFAGQRQWMESSEGVSALTIGEMREDDEGEYTINIKNSLGSADHKFKLVMDALPEINRVDRYSSPLVLDQGETVKLRLSFAGKPAPSVEWLDNQGKTIEDSRKFKIEKSGVNTVLSINKIAAEDRGEYTLKVKNRCGEDQYPITIQITDRPGPPGKPTVQDQNVDQVRLMWAAPTHDGGSAVRNYTVEMISGKSKKWMKAEVTKQPFISLFNLVPGETYRFRVKADNAFGISDPSEESEQVFVKDLSRTVEEPKKQVSREEPEAGVNYDKLDSKVTASEYKTVDIHKLPNDLQAKYIICEELGRGAYGTVYRAIEKATGKTWAAKMVQVRPGVKKENVLHEITMMNQLHHEKLLNLHEAFDLGNEMCLIEEFVSGGELFEKIMEDDSLMSEEEVRDYMHQILLGVQHMHQNQIVHLDLKPENILLKSKNSTDLKIIDFGLARKLEPKKSVKLLFGTPEFCAPEVVNYQPVGFSTDMWTCGVISYVLLSGLSPFLGDTDEETLANVSTADWDFEDPSWDDVSDSAKDFICRLMVKDKKRRMTVQDALRHPWITGPLLSAFNDLADYVKKTQPAPERGPVPARQKRNFLSLKRWSDDLLPIGRLAKRGAIFRRLTMDGVFERNVCFDTDCAPSIRKRLEDIVANVGDLIATMSCDLDGNPTPRISWFKDEKPVPTASDKYSSRFTDGLAELIVKNIEESDAGLYSCRATNDLGSITTDAGLRVEGEGKKKKTKADTTTALAKKKKVTEKKPVAEEPSEKSPPDFHHKLSDTSVKVGETKILVVTNTTLPEPTVEWYHEGENILESDSRYLRKHDKGRYELEILGAECSDAGQWRAVGKNAYGMCESTCKLTVEVPDGQYAPSFDHPLTDVRCAESEILKLEVKIDANPAPEISWFRNDSELSHGDRHRLQYDDSVGHYTLTIINAYKEDSGEYKCLAKNKIGKAHTLCCVRIEEIEEKKSKKIDANKAPKFRMHLPNPREVPEGSELALVCVVTGTPYPSVNWLKDEKRIDMAGKLVKCENGVCTLSIPATAQSDAGTYVCEAENIHGTTRSTSIVEIKEAVEKQAKPMFLDLLVNSSVCEGNEIVLECCVKTAKPMPTITWYKDGLKLIIENRMLQYTDRKGVARLNIMNVTLDDAGEYTCEAVNNAGKDFTHCTVKVADMGLSKPRLSPARSRSRSRSPSVLSGAEELRAPQITRPLVDTTVVAGNRELLEVEVDGAPTPMIEWYHDGKLVAESRTLRTYFDGRVAFLKIYEAQQDHQGEYVCKVSNKVGAVESRATLMVSTQPGPAEHVPNMPTFVKKPEDVLDKKIGDSASLSCQFNGVPLPTVCWLHNGRAINQQEQSSNTQIRVFDDNRSVLEIPKVTEDLCGTYTVVVTNEFGDAHSSAEVHLEETAARTATVSMPYFVVEPKPKYIVDEGATLSIVTDVNGTPQPEISWLKDNRPLKEGERIQFKEDGITRQLIITNIRADDEGTYTVTAENKKGKARQNSEVVVALKRAEAPAPSVKVAKKDQAPSEPGQPTAGDVTSDTVTITWSPPSESGGSDVESYKVEMRQPDTQQWKEVASLKEIKTKISNLSPSTEYVFRVTAKNRRGYGSPSGTSAPIKTLSKGEKPTFATSAPSSLSITQEQGISITTAFSGTPQPQVKWYRNGSELLDSDKVTLALGDGIASVIVSDPVKGIDDGVYSCHISNSEGHASCETKVTIIKEAPEEFDEEPKSETSSVKLSSTGGVPTLQRALNQETAQAGQQIVLTCKITSKPAGKVSWFRDNEAITATGRYEISSKTNGTQKLTVHSCTVNDSGKYRCVVENEKGIAQSECEVVVHDVTQQTAPKFEKPLEDATGMAGKQLTLSCKVSAVPEPQFMWTKDGEPITSSRKMKLLFEEGGVCKLIINSCTGSDTGMYLCSASNVVGVESSGCMLTVAETHGADSHLVMAELEEEKSAQNKPKFIRAPASTMEVMEGGQFKLVAKAVGEPKPNVIWKKDGREILRTNRLYKSYVTGDGESHLIAEMVVSKTSGIFTCVAQNVHGEEISETQIIVQRGKILSPIIEAPKFLFPLKDMGVVDGHPVTLSCKVRGVPEPELKWFYIDDSGNSTCLTSAGSGWIECRGGEFAEIKAERVYRSQQGTYQCVATNSKGEATSSCYMLVGGLSDEPAGPPRFVKCLRDIWTPLSESVIFDVEVAGFPVPDITWYQNDKKIKEGKNVEIRYVSDTLCELRINETTLRELGSYYVEASNVHGVVRTAGSLNVGEPRHLEPPKFQQPIADEAITVKSKVAFNEEVKKSASTVRMEMKRKGAPPVFVQGLEDMDLKAGDSAAVAGKLGRKHRNRAPGFAAAPKSPRMDAKGLAASILAGIAMDEESGRISADSGKSENALVIEMRQAIHSRNKKMCRPKFMVKPKPKKVLEEYKSLRLKTAISANPVPSVYWDKDGIILETGNKYSIYNDGDFYYLEVHHVSIFDKGFYNCCAANSEGIVTCTSEVEVTPSVDSPTSSKRRSRKEPKAPQFIEVLPGKVQTTMGESLSVECSVSGYPAPWIEWFRNGAPLVPQTERYMMSYDGECASLKFNYVSPSDEGKYSCEARNEHGQCKTQMTLNVDSTTSGPSDGQPPQFRTEKIRSVFKVMDGDRVELAADLVQGSEPVQIRWLHNKVTITDSSSFQYIRRGKAVMLQIADAFPEDAGEYTVEAKNQWGTAKCLMRLDITSNDRSSMMEDAPRITAPADSVRVVCGMAAELRATVTGHPDPVIEWAKGDNPCHSGEKYTMCAEGNLFILRVNELLRTDAGKYSLTAVNVAGQTTKNFELIVAEPSSSSTVQPRFTHSPVSVQVRLGQRAELRARFAGQPLPTCKWFKGDTQLQDGIGGVSIVDSADSSTLSIVFLENIHVGEYLCTVRNPYGEDLATAFILIEGGSAALPQRRSIAPRK